MCNNFGCVVGFGKKSGIAVSASTFKGPRRARRDLFSVGGSVKPALGFSACGDLFRCFSSSSVSKKTKANGKCRNSCRFLLHSRARGRVILQKGGAGGVVHVAHLTRSTAPCLTTTVQISRRVGHLRKMLKFDNVVGKGRLTLLCASSRAFGIMCSKRGASASFVPATAKVRFCLPIRINNGRLRHFA